MKRILINNIYSILFSTVIVISVLKVSGFSIPEYIIFSPIFILSLAIFFLCEYALENPKRGTFFLLLIFTVICLASLYTIKSSSTIINFIISLKYGSLSFKFQMIILFGGTFLVSCIVYYFTNIAYRSYIFFLLNVFPVIFYQTRKVEFPNIYVVVFSILSVVLMIDSHRKVFSKETNYRYSLSMLKFCLFIFIIILFLPNVNKTPYSLIDILDNNESASTDFASSNRFSGKNYSVTNNKDLFTVSADESVYLKRQTFGSYVNDTSGYWVYVQNDKLRRGNNITVDDELVFEQKFLNPEVLGILLERAGGFDSSFKSEEYVKYVDILKNTKMDVKKATLYYKDFSSSTIPSPLGTIKVTNLPEEAYKNPIGETFSLDWIPNNSLFDLEYYDFKQSTEAEIISQNLDFDTYKSLIYELTNLYIFLQQSNELKIMQFFKSDVDNISEYMNTLRYGTPERTAELAKKITAGKTSDYEKALALQNYFHTNDYLYDLDYRAPVGKEDNEYFLFESKRGTCSDFATAMTLMGKSVGLIIRYSEGFLPELDEDGGYIVRTKNSHAYPEVYIAGYGWVVFEPTVSTLAENKTTEYYGKLKIYLLLGIVCLIMISALCYILKKLLLPIIEETIFRSRIKRSDVSTAVILIYKRIIWLISVNKNISAETFTPKMLSKLLYDEYNLDISEFIKAYEQLAFSEKNPGSKAKSNFYSLYLSLYEIVHKKNSRH